MNRSDTYTEKLQFEVPGGETADPDEAVMRDAVLHEAGEKAKDVLGLGDD